MSDVVYLAAEENSSCELLKDLFCNFKSNPNFVCAANVEGALTFVDKQKTDAIFIDYPVLNQNVRQYGPSAMRRKLANCEVPVFVMESADKLLSDLNKNKNGAMEKRQQSEAIAKIVHDLRSPISVIISFTKFLLNHSPASSVEARKYLEVIKRNAEHCNSQVNDLMDLSRIDLGLFYCQRSEVDLLKELSLIMFPYYRQGISSGIKFSVHFSGQIPRCIHTDLTRLQQILYNLLNNAFKFTKAGGIDVAISTQSSESGTALLKIEVKDSGTGIPPEIAAKLFQSFTSHINIGNRDSGLGLGLFLSRQMAQTLGGDLRLITSKPDQGSVFCLTVDSGVATGSAYEPNPNERFIQYIKEFNLIG